MVRDLNEPIREAERLAARPMPPEPTYYDRQQRDGDAAVRERETIRSATEHHEAELSTDLAAVAVRMFTAVVDESERWTTGV